MARNCRRWTNEEDAILIREYPRIGLVATCNLLGRTRGAVRARASLLGVKQDKTSPFFENWQKRAAKSKVGKKRPDQAIVMKQLHAAGKLKQTPELRKATGQKTRERIARDGHPRGALGMKHTAKSLAAMSEASRRKWATMTDAEKVARELKRAKTFVERGHKFPKHGNWKAGWRTVGGKECYFRSRWEANYARYLQWLVNNGDIKGWDHEPETFWFEGVKRGTVSYLPDFRVNRNDGFDEFHEVKGWMDDKSKTKIRRMKKYHPKVTLIVIDSKSYKSIEKMMQGVIAGWELGSRNHPAAAT
jgi:hypothetical protein